MVTWLVTTYQAGHAGFDQLAAYAGIAAVIYGMLAVAVDLGGQAVFYTIAAIIKFIDEWKAEKDAKAVERVSSNPELWSKPFEMLRTRATPTGKPPMLSDATGRKRARSFSKLQAVLPPGY